MELSWENSGLYWRKVGSVNRLAGLFWPMRSAGRRVGSDVLQLVAVRLGQEPGHQQRGEIEVLAPGPR